MFHIPFRLKWHALTNKNKISRYTYTWVNSTLLNNIDYTNLKRNKRVLIELVLINARFKICKNTLKIV